MTALRKEDGGMGIGAAEGVQTTGRKRLRLGFVDGKAAQPIQGQGADAFTHGRGV